MFLPTANVDVDSYVLATTPILSLHGVDDDDERGNAFFSRSAVVR